MNETGSEEQAERVGRKLVDIYKEAARRAGPTFRREAAGRWAGLEPRPGLVLATHVLVMEVLQERAAGDPDLAEFKGLVCDCERCQTYRQYRTGAAEREHEPPAPAP